MNTILPALINGAILSAVVAAAAVGLIATSSPLAAISSVTRSRPPANPTPGVDGQPSASARPS